MTDSAPVPPALPGGGTSSELDGAAAADALDAAAEAESSGEMESTACASLDLAPPLDRFCLCDAVGDVLEAGEREEARALIVKWIGTAQVEAESGSASGRQRRYCREKRRLGRAKGEAKHGIDLTNNNSEADSIAHQRGERVPARRDYRRIHSAVAESIAAAAES